MRAPTIDDTQMVSTGLYLIFHMVAMIAISINSHLSVMSVGNVRTFWKRVVRTTVEVYNIHDLFLAIS